jgi:hypothetical protein
VSEQTHNAPRLFNSVFETGVRAVFVLVSVYPECLDLEDLVALDHLVVHAEDVGGPHRLHPATSTHATEMLVRRKLVDNGLLLMQARSLVDRLANSEGIFYRAGDEARNFVSYLISPYFEQLGEAARFLASLRTKLGKTGFNQLVEEQLERWAIQFQTVSTGTN